MARLISGTVFFLFTFAFSASALAQGVQTGSVRGVVRDSAGQVVAQATIRATSPALLGDRTTTSDQVGAYQLTGLAAGEYTIAIEFTGFRPVTSTLRVGVGAIESLDAMLAPASVTEAVMVAAAAPSLVSKRTGGVNLRTGEIDLLPTGRTPSLVAELEIGRAHV